MTRTPKIERIPYARRPKTLPVVLSAAEVARLIEAVDDLVCRTALATVYATGLRTAEVLSLRIEHIESARGLIRVEEGEGRKDRYVLLSPTLGDAARLLEDHRSAPVAVHAAGRPGPV